MDDLQYCYRHPGRETRVTCSECGRPICPDCMVFAPVGIRCPDHASVGRMQGDTRRQVRSAQHRVRSTGAPATLTLIAMNVLVYLITVYQGDGLNDPGGTLFYEGGLTIHGGAYRESDSISFYEGLAGGEWWRLVTPMFLHGSVLHLAFNMLALWVIGSIVEPALGTVRYLLVYFVSGIAGAAGALLLSPDAFTVGASGAIFGIMGSLLILEWLQTGSFAGQAMAFIVLNLFITFAIPNVSIGGHLGGLIGGIATTFVLVEARRRRLPAFAAPALAVAVGVVAVSVAYIRVESYV